MKRFAVIADDFTGAAEIAGICLRYGLKAIVFNGAVEDTDAVVLIVNTDSRSMNREKAMDVTEKAVRALLALHPEWIYKKTDSVMRGYVLDELVIQMECAGFDKVFYLPANPSLGRTINSGMYFIGELKVNETGFAADPEFPVKDANVLKMIGAAGNVTVKKHTDDLDTERIVIGEAVTSNDVKKWVNKLDDGWMKAGAGDFFTAILEQEFQRAGKKEMRIQLPHLYICGTAFGRSKALIKKIDAELNCVAYLPAISDDASDDVNKWIDGLVKLLKKQKRVIIAIDENNATGATTALAMRTWMAAMVKIIAEQAGVRELFIEGGSTAAAVLEVLNIHTLVASDELERGVVCMKANGFSITVKPGSYELPAQISRIYS